MKTGSSGQARNWSLQLGAGYDDNIDRLNGHISCHISGFGYG
jgi:hypothetical protein